MIAKVKRDQKWLAEKLVYQMDREPKTKAAVIAELCGVSRQAVNGWRNDGRIDKQNLPKLAALFKTSERYWLSPTAVETRQPGDERRQPNLTVALAMMEQLFAKLDADHLQIAADVLRHWASNPDRRQAYHDHLAGILMLPPEAILSTYSYPSRPATTPAAARALKAKHKPVLRSNGAEKLLPGKGKRT